MNNIKLSQEKEILIDETFQIEQIITGIINVVSLIELTIFTIKRPSSQP